MNTKQQILNKLILILAALALVNCGKKASEVSSSASEDTSASAIAAESAGGALSNSSSSGTQARMSFALPNSMYASLRSELSPMPNASAQSFCPTFRSTDSECSASGASLWLTYTDCSFLGKATWNGVQAITMSSGSAACGTFPNPGANGTLYRQFVSASGGSTPGEVTLTAGGYSGVIDDATANLGNFDGDSIPAIQNGGYGEAVSFDASGVRSSVEIKHRVAVAGVFDHSVSGNLAVSEASDHASRTLSGQVTVYHNLMRVIGTSTFNNVVHENVCCVPVSGSITTVFSAGANVSPRAAAEAMIGKSETLTFNGCGSATLVDYQGNSKEITLKRCF